MSQPQPCRRDAAGGDVRARRLSCWKKAAFALVATILFFLSVELALTLAGVEPILTTDPFVGVSSQAPLFIEQRRPDGRVVMRTAPAKLAHFNAQQFPKQKTEGVFRVFCVGGSTTYGRPYDDATSFSAWLRQLLPLVEPGRQWEVVNAGGVSYASYRVAAVMAQLARYDPDLFIVYTGHNEFLEERTYRNVRLWKTLRPVRAPLQQTRAYALIDRLAGSLRSNPPADLRQPMSGEVDAILDHTVGPSSYHRDDVLRSSVLDHFKVNLHRMIDIARSCGAAIVLVTPACNEKDFAPFKSEHRTGLSPDQQAVWERHFKHGRTCEDRQDAADALVAYRAATRIDDRFAQLHYRLGQVLLALDRRAEAGAALVRAVDEDICPLRALTGISNIIRRAAARREVPVIDFQNIVKNDCLRRFGHNVPGRAYFLDHVHPTIDGHRMLASALLERMQEMGIVGETDAGWKQTVVEKVARRIHGRLDPVKRSEALRNLAKVLNWAGKHDEAGRLAMKAANGLPRDPEVMLISAAYLREQGDAERAIALFRRALLLRPDYLEAHQLLGAMLVDRHQLDKAFGHFEAVARLQPENADAHHTLGMIRAEQGVFDQALPYFQTANRIKSEDADVLYNLGLALARLGRARQAAHWFHRALAQAPGDADAHYQLALLQLDAGETVKAIDHLRRAVALRIDFAEAEQVLQRVDEERRKK